MATTTKKRFRELFLDAIGFFLVTTTSGTGGTAVEFMPFHPDWIHAAMREGIQKSYPFLYKHLLDETLIVDDLLTNSDFETGATDVFTGWTTGGASAADAEDTSNVIHGTRSLKLTSASATAQEYQNITVNVQELVGKPIHFERWVGAIASNVARIGFEFASGVTDFHAYHTGKGAAFGTNIHWEYQSHVAVVPSTVEYVRAICEVATGTKVGYFDGPGGVWVDRKRKYTIPTSFVGMPELVWIQDQLDPNGRYVKLSTRPKSGRLLRLEGRGRLTVPSTETQTIEVDETQAALIVAIAAVELFRRLRRLAATDDFDDDISYWSSESSRLARPQREGGVVMTSGAVHNPDGWWKHSEDSDGQYLMLR